MILHPSEVCGLLMVLFGFPARRNKNNAGGVRYTAVSRGRGCERFSNFDPYQSYLLKKLREKQVESVIDPLFCFSETH